MFEEFVARVDAKDNDSNPDSWEHETMSGEILKRNKIDVQAYFSTTAVGEEQIAFVIELIKGLHDHEEWPKGTGRGEDKRFLFDIVSCSRNGIDVDKLDYLAREALAAFGNGAVRQRVDRESVRFLISAPTASSSLIQSFLSIKLLRQVSL
jgi:deoxynucleoside triphosphate triphosphohydrolase SAMHD1